MTVARDFILRLVSDPREIVRCRSPQQKPFLRVHFDSGEIVELPLSLLTRLTDEIHIIKTMHDLKSQTVIPIRNHRKKEEP